MAGRPHPHIDVSPLRLRDLAQRRAQFLQQAGELVSDLWISGNQPAEPSPPLAFQISLGLVVAGPRAASSAARESASSSSSVATRSGWTRCQSDPTADLARSQPSVVRSCTSVAAAWDSIAPSSASTSSPLSYALV